jgi:hypothetical protein
VFRLLGHEAGLIIGGGVGHGSGPFPLAMVSPLFCRCCCIAGRLLSPHYRYLQTAEIKAPSAPPAVAAVAPGFRAGCGRAWRAASIEEA